MMIPVAAFAAIAGEKWRLISPKTTAATAHMVADTLI